MSIVRCPQCRDEVSVPTHVSAEVIVECPWCRERYALAEALRQAPPMLRVVGFGPPWAGAQPAAGESADLQLAPLEPVRPVIRDDGGPRRRPGSLGRRPTRSKNVFVELAKIVLGGLVGLTIGQLILWWMPGRWAPSQRDPLALARHVGLYVPWIVPEDLRSAGAMRSWSGASDDQGNQRREVIGVAPSKRPTGATSERGAQPQTSRVPNVPLTDELDATSAPRDGSRGESLPASTAKTSQDTSPTAKGSARQESTQGSRSPQPLPPREPVPVEEVRPPRQEGPSGERKTPTADSSSQSQPTPRIERPVATADSVMRLLQATQFSLQQTLEEGTSDTVSASLMAELAHDVTFLDLNQPENTDVFLAVQEWLAKVAHDVSQCEALMKRLGQPRDSGAETGGHIVFGRVVEKKRAGSVLEVVVEEPNQRHCVVLVTDTNLALDANDFVLVLGSMLADPSQDVPGYRGNAEKPILSGVVWKPQAR